MDEEASAYFDRYRLDRFLPHDVLDHLSLEHFQPGETILEAGRPVDALRFFVEGRARVVLPEENGRQLLLCFYEPLQLFGDAEIMERGRDAAASIEALGSCICLSLARKAVERCLYRNPEFLRMLCRSLGRKLGRILQNSAFNQLYPLEARVASYILATAVELKNGKVLFSANISQVAELLGSSFRHLHRTLGALCDAGVLEKTRSGYLLHNSDELKQRAGATYTLATWTSGFQEDAAGA